VFVRAFFFFFSSRRRHTRCLSDWSSDVCSSDLAWSAIGQQVWNIGAPGPMSLPPHLLALTRDAPRAPEQRLAPRPIVLDAASLEIGRASCRERATDAGRHEPRNKQDRQKKAQLH